MNHASITVQIYVKAELARDRIAYTPRQVDAYVLGRWALHLTWDTAGGEDYSVTHVPSGLVLADRMTRKQAADLARMLTLSLDVEKIERNPHNIAIAEREVRLAGGRFLREADLRRPR